MPAAFERTEFSFLFLFRLLLGMISCYKHTFPYAVRQRHFFRPRKIALHRSRQPNNILVELNFIRPRTEEKYKCMHQFIQGGRFFSLSLFCFAFISKKNDAKPANGVKKSNHPNALHYGVYLCTFFCVYASAKERD